MTPGTPKRNLFTVTQDNLSAPEKPQDRVLSRKTQDSQEETANKPKKLQTQTEKINKLL